MNFRNLRTTILKLAICRLAAILWLLSISLGASGAGGLNTPTTGTLEGRLTDTHSIPLIQTVVVVRNLATQVAMQTITGKDGKYHFANLTPGEYRLEATVTAADIGSSKGSVEGILISAGHATRVQAALILHRPSVAQLLGSEPESHALDPILPAVTTTIASEELESVPVASRNWQGFEALTPGSNPESAGGERGGQSRTQLGEAEAEDDASADQLQSGAGSQTTSTVDGIESTPAFHVPGQRAANQGSTVGESAVQSLEARTGNAAASDTADTTGASVNLVTSHGHHGLHGQAFYLNKQPFWAALNPFTQWVRETAPANGVAIAQFTAEAYSPNQTRQTIGIGIGSQIRPVRILKYSKLYWFAALDGLLRDDPAVATVRHPLEFFARPTDPELTVLAARLDLPEPAILEQAASAYSAGLEQLANLLGPVPRTASQWQGFGRIDWQLTDRQNLALDTNLSNVNAPGGALTRTSQTFGSHSFGDSKASEIWGAANLQSFLTANLLNSAALQYRWHTQSQTPQTPSAFEAPLIANQWGELPEIIADSTYGFILGKPARLGGSKYPEEQSYVAQDTLSWVRGTHLIKAGGSFDHITDQIDTLVNQTGTYSYADVLNFVSDAASFEKYGFADIGNPQAGEHNCDATGRVHTIAGQPSGLGFLPCYAWYSQRIGPSNWNLSTNDFAGFFTEQWQPRHYLTISSGFRVQAEQLPAAIPTMANADIPNTQKLPAASLLYGPRFGIAWSPLSGTVVRMGAGLYYGRIDNSTALAALSQTGSPNGDLNFFFKPTDAGAPPFPYVFPAQPQTVVAPGAVSFANHFHQQQVDQAIFGLEKELPNHWLIAANLMVSLGRHLPISIDTNLSQAVDAKGNPKAITYDVVDPVNAGPIKSAQVSVPFYTARPNTQYQQIASIESRANSTYDAAMVKITRYGAHGFTLRAHYLYAHATDFNPNESGQVAENDILDPSNFGLEYGTSNLDIRHSAAFTVLYRTPWRMKGSQLRNATGYLVNNWSMAAVGQYRSGLPYTMRTSGYLPGYYEPLLSGGHTLIEGVAPGINGSGGDNRLYSIGRNTYRYNPTYTADARIAKRFTLPHDRELELLAESFNLFNHQNVTLIETTGYTVDRGSTTGGNPTLRFLNGLTNAGVPSLTTVEFGKPLDINATNFYQPRQFQLGIRTRF